MTQLLLNREIKLSINSSSQKATKQPNSSNTCESLLRKDPFNTANFAHKINWFVKWRCSGMTYFLCLLPLLHCYKNWRPLPLHPFPQTSPNTFILSGAGKRKMTEKVHTDSRLFLMMNKVNHGTNMHHIFL